MYTNIQCYSETLNFKVFSNVKRKAYSFQYNKKYMITGTVKPQNEQNKSFIKVDHMTLDILDVFTTVHKAKSGVQLLKNGSSESKLFNKTRLKK